MADVPGCQAMFSLANDGDTHSQQPRTTKILVRSMKIQDFLKYDMDPEKNAVSLSFLDKIVAFH